ncbi:MAG: sugar phosphate isomerase/epimerase [Bacteroidetes bacterium]|nr:MAG: sugar phosphate isomerase/epimerase [Bacteroidota bacterium]
MKDLSRLCVHTITTRPWPLARAVEAFADASIGGMTVWRDAVPEEGPQQAGERIRAAGLEVVSYCRGGFFPHTDAQKRQAAIDDNLAALDEAAALGAPLLVLVCGAAPGQSLERSRQQIRAGIEAILPRAQALGVRLAIEPLHPMYADTRSAINTLRQANEMAEAIKSPYLGVAVDVYHLWWDPELEHQIARCGENAHLFAFHVCDWRVPTRDLLNDRGLMGEGCINIRQIRKWVEDAGFDGFHEVEIFSMHYWNMDQAIFLKQIVQAYKEHV